MILDQIYLQNFYNGGYYAKILLGISKNGGYKSLLVRKYDGKKAEKPKQFSVRNTSLWTQIKDINHIPKDVLKRFKEYKQEVIAYE